MPFVGRTPEESLKFMVQLVRTASDFVPDYHELARVAGINNANNAQRRFKTIVEADGNFKLIYGRIVAVTSANPGPPASSSDTPTPATTTPTKKRAATGPPPASTKPAARKKIKKNPSMSGAAIAGLNNKEKTDTKETLTRSITKTAKKDVKMPSADDSNDKDDESDSNSAPMPTPEKEAPAWKFFYTTDDDEDESS